MEQIYPRIKYFLRDLQNPKITFSAILGAGISVSAGLSAFRSNNSIFQQLQTDYQSWPEKSSEVDSFLSYAFSVKCLLNDPRLQYRVLSKFDESTRNSIFPSISHCFLSYLCEIERMDKIITQNVDNLEFYSQIPHLLGPRHITAHGEFYGDLTCFNPICPSFQKLKILHAQNNNHDQILATMNRFLPHLSAFSTSQQRNFFLPNSDLKLDGSSLKYDKSVLISALEDDAVPICQFCGAALKTKMVLYGEEIQIQQQALNQILRRSQSVLVIGTSLNVFPVNSLILQTSPAVSVHFVAKNINFNKFFNIKNSFQKLIVDRFAVKKFKNATVKTGQNINNITPLVCFHRSASDDFFLAVLDQCEEEVKNRVFEIQKESEKRVKESENRNTILMEQLETQQVIIQIPELWPPDCAVYDMSGTVSGLFLCTEQQILMIRERFALILSEKYTESGVLVLGDTRFIGGEGLDQVSYKPLNGHYASYCVGYNAYKLVIDDYIEELDPWSSQFIGYKRKTVFYEKVGYFSYSGVYRNYLTILGLRGQDLIQYFKQVKIQLEGRCLLITK